MKGVILRVLFDKNSDVSKKKYFTFSFRGDTQKNLYKNPQEEGRKRCWDCALPSPARARKDTTTTSARLDARAPAEGASSSSSSSFLVYYRRFRSAFFRGVRLEFFYPNKKD